MELRRDLGGTGESRLSSPGRQLRGPGMGAAGLAALAAAVALGLAAPAEAQRFRGGGFGGRAGGGGLAERFGGARDGAAAGGIEGRFQGSGGEAGAAGERPFEQRRQERSGTGESLGDTQSNSWETRRGGSIDTSKTTDGDSTTRDATVTGAGGNSAEHSGTVTKDDGSFSYSGSGSTSAGGSSATSASGTTSGGKVTSMDTSASGTNAAGESATHDGHWNRDGDTVGYYGSTSTSTGRDSAAAGTVTKTDDGFVAHGAAVTDQGAARGTVVKDGDQVYGHSVATDGATVNRNWTTCNGGDCTRTTVTSSVPAVTSYSYYAYPASYAYYACPPGSVTMVHGAAGTAVYSCSTTPITAMTIPLGAMMMAGAAAKSHGAQSSAQVTSSPVVMYQVSSDVAVYATSYQPSGLYWERVKDRYLWVPGAATESAGVSRDIERASQMSAPTANATVVTYSIGGSLVYLTNQKPITGIFNQDAGGVWAWIPGVTSPTQAQRDAIATAVTAHQQGGAQAIEAEVQKMESSREPS